LLPALAKFVDDGEAAGCSPLAATACGLALADGNVGAAAGVFAATAVSADVFSHGFHQAQFGPDWQPTNPATMPANIIKWTAARFIILPSTSAGINSALSDWRNCASLNDNSARPLYDIDQNVARMHAIGQRKAATAGNCKRLRRLRVREKGGL
jgi:hypothetical protein